MEESWKSNDGENEILSLRACVLLGVSTRCYSMLYYSKDNGFYLHFAGQVTIEFHVEKETNFIVLHIQDLNITEKVILFFDRFDVTCGLASMLAHAEIKKRIRQLVVEMELS